MIPRSEATALAGVSEGLLAYFASRGLERDAMLQAAGLTPQMLAHPDARVPASHLWRLWRFVISRSGDAEVGLECAQQIQVKQFGLVGYTMIFSQTALQAIRRLERYSKILSETLRYRIEEDRAQVLLSLERDPRSDMLRHPVDLRLGAVLTALSEITGSPLTPAAVRFSYARPENTAGLAKFFHAPLSFDADEACLVMRRADLDRPVQQADARLSGYLDELAGETLRKIGDTGSLAGRVRSTIWTDLADGAPTLAGVAVRMGLSERTLQRRLEEEHTSFSSVVEGLRREMAQSLLREGDLAIYQVGFLLGYSDPAAFHRAFRRWTSRSPRDFRRQAATNR